MNIQFSIDPLNALLIALSQMAAMALIAFITLRVDRKK
jgi:hypothetical protein